MQIYAFLMKQIFYLIYWRKIGFYFRHIGDVLQITLRGLLLANAAAEVIIDSGTIVSGAVLHVASPGTKGLGHGYNGTTSSIGFNGTVYYTVVSSDIVNGVVTVSPIFVNTGAGAGTLFADATYLLTYNVINLKH